MQHKQREGFNSRMGALLAIAGSAIGLGNLWKFPYMVGENGGSIFILFYLIFVALICLPVMLSELVIGRNTQRNIFGAFKKLVPGTAWRFIGTISITAAFVILSFYSVVAGWTLEYIFQSAQNAFKGQTVEQIGQFFTDFSTSTFRPLLWHFVFMALTAYIVLFGVQRGIERCSKLLMPLLFLLIILLMIRSLTLPGAVEGIQFLFRPDWSKFSTQMLVGALGQAFFSLSLGMGVMVTYASYISKKEPLVKTAVEGSMADTVFAVIAAVAIVPAIFAFGLAPTQGPGLAFVALPSVFQEMPGGIVFAVIFFIIFLLAALTSSISILEVQVAYWVEEFHVKRRTATALTAIATAVVGVFCSLSFGVMSDFKILGKTFFELMDFLATNVLLPVGSLLFVIFAGWHMSKAVMHRELSMGTRRSMRLFSLILFFVIRYVAPIAIVLVLLSAFF
jgi:NSS family neurotransmitter:Na+ symporter